MYLDIKLGIKLGLGIALNYAQLHFVILNWVTLNVYEKLWTEKIFIQYCKRNYLK